MDEPVAGLGGFADCVTTTKPETVPVWEAARILGISREAAYQAVNRKPPAIPCIRIGRRILVPVAKLNEMLGKAQVTP
jgi:Helix-turn-helix domain